MKKPVILYLSGILALIILAHLIIQLGQPTNWKYSIGEMSNGQVVAYALCFVLAACGFVYGGTYESK
jgi:hypothetical protein